MKGYPRGLPVLLGIMVILALAYVLGPFLGSVKFAPPLQPWMTEKVVAEGLDGQQIIDATVKPAGVIVLRKDAITSLRMRGLDHESIRVEFNLDRDGRKYRVDGRVWWREERADGALRGYRLYHFDADVKQASP